MKEGLYFIGILPPDDIAEQVQKVKKVFVERYDSKEAYRKPPHFTLQVPFKMPEKAEEIIIPPLTFFAKDQTAIYRQIIGLQPLS